MKGEQDDSFVISGSLVQGVLEGNDPAQMVNEIDRSVIQKIASGLSIGFVPEKEREGEVCFMNSEEVRPEFKVSFAPADIFNYIIAVLQSPDLRAPLQDKLQIPYPKDATGFWELVKKGERLRGEQRCKK